MKIVGIVLEHDLSDFYQNRMQRFRVLLKFLSKYQVLAQKCHLGTEFRKTKKCIFKSCCMYHDLKVSELLMEKYLVKKSTLVG